MEMQPNKKTRVEEEEAMPNARWESFFAFAMATRAELAEKGREIETIEQTFQERLERYHTELGGTKAYKDDYLSNGGVPVLHKHRPEWDELLAQMLVAQEMLARKRKERHEIRRPFDGKREDRMARHAPAPVYVSSRLRDQLLVFLHEFYKHVMGQRGALLPLPHPSKYGVDEFTYVQYANVYFVHSDEPEPYLSTHVVSEAAGVVEVTAKTELEMKRVWDYVTRNHAALDFYFPVVVHTPLIPLGREVGIIFTPHSPVQYESTAVMYIDVSNRASKIRGMFSSEWDMDSLISRFDEVETPAERFTQIDVLQIVPEYGISSGDEEARLLQEGVTRRRIVAAEKEYHLKPYGTCGSEASGTTKTQRGWYKRFYTHYVCGRSKLDDAEEHSYDNLFALMLGRMTLADLLSK